MLIKFRLTQGKHYAHADGRSVVIYLDGGTKKKVKGHHCLHPGDIMACADPDMLQYFKDRFVQITPDPPPEQPKSGFTLDALENGKFNVINSKTGEALNDEPVSQDIAESLLIHHADKQTKEGDKT